MVTCQQVPGLGSGVLGGSGRWVLSVPPALAAALSAPARLCTVVSAPPALSAAVVSARPPGRADPGSGRSAPPLHHHPEFNTRFTWII